MKKISALLFLCFSILISCTGGEQKYDNFTLSSKFLKDEKNQDEVIYFAYTSSLNSKIVPHQDEFLEGSKIEFGGETLINKYITAMRTKVKNLVLIDGGQILATDYHLGGELILNNFQDMNYDAILLSDHELLTFKNNVLPDGIPFVNSNLIALDTNSSFIQHGNQEYIIKEIEGVKIGIIGLTPYKPKLKKQDGLEGILFDDVVARVIEIKKKLKGKTDFNIALLHSHTKCSDRIDYRFKECKLDTASIKAILERLPPDTFDIIFSGNSFQAQTQIMGYPVVSNLGHGEFITFVSYDKKTKRVEAKQVRVCSKFYAETKSCYIDPDDIDSTKTVRKSKMKLLPAKVFDSEIL